MIISKAGGVVAGLSAALVFLAGYGLSDWRSSRVIERLNNTIDQYQKDYDASLLRWEGKLAEAELRHQEVLDEREERIAELDVAASRIPDTVTVTRRVLVTPDCPADSGDGRGAGDDPGTHTAETERVLPDGTAEDTFTLGTRRLRELMREADEVNQNLIELMRLCRAS